LEPQQNKQVAYVRTEDGLSTACNIDGLAMFGYMMDFLHENVEDRIKGKSTRGRKKIQVPHDLAK